MRISRSWPLKTLPTRFGAAVISAAGVLTVALGLFSQAPAEAAAPKCKATHPSLAHLLTTEPPRAVSETPFTDENGTPITLGDLAKDGPLVVNFWATWCIPCLREMPQLDRLKKIVEGDGINVIAVSQDRQGLKKVKPFFKRKGYKNLEILLDPKADFARAENVRGLPTTLLIDGNGLEVARLAGLNEWDSEASIDFVRQCLTPGKAS